MQRESRQRRTRMVSEQIEARGVRDGDVLDAMRTVPRHLFVPADLEEKAYVDAPLAIGFGQTISQPYMVGLMTELLAVNVRSRVLEVGGGSGYQTAVLAELAGHVFSLERIASLAERARALLTRFAYDNISVAIGDGSLGWADEAPFDAILVAAAAEHVPPPLLDQLAAGGRLVMPIGRSQEQTLTVIERQADQYVRRSTIGCRFVPLISGENPQAAADRPSADTKGVAMKSVEIVVTGKVQGVYYRAHADEQARRLGLRGWVKNCSDGTVHMRLLGERDDVDAMIDWSSVGPPAARVARVEVEDVPADGELSAFEIR